MKRRVQIMLLGEDLQHLTFARRFLVACGWRSDQIRDARLPSGKGAGDQWVKQNYAREVRALRAARHVSKGLIVIVDADSSTVTGRKKQLSEELSQAGVADRTPTECIVIAVPRRNIETWIHYLDGKTVDESSAYQKLSRASACGGAVSSLKQMCDDGSLREPFPPSLGDACDEFVTRLKK